MTYTTTPQITYAVPPPRGMSIASMVIGIVSVFLGFTFFVPIVGLILGIVGLKREPHGRGMAITGIVINGLILAGWLIVLVVTLLIMIAGGGLGLFAIFSNT